MPAGSVSRSLSTISLSSSSATWAHAACANSAHRADHLACRVGHTTRSWHEAIGGKGAVDIPEVTSDAGTAIAYERQGDGPALIGVDGALTARRSESKVELVELLSPRLRVYVYDRRGRGDSGDIAPYAVEREIEDIAAVIGEAGGSAALYGHSSGACLALEAALALGSVQVTKLAMYEAPYDDDPAAREGWERYLAEMTVALADGRPGDAAALFMTFVGTPADQLESVRQAPFWPGIEAVAATGRSAGRRG